MAFNRFCRAALEGRALSVFGGDQVRDFTYVQDVVSATKSAARAPEAVGGTYNVGGGSQVELMMAIRLLEQFIGRPVAVDRGEMPPGDVRATGADISRARADLGYEPSVPFEEGLRAEFDWARAGSPAVAALKSSQSS
jgi:UDP-glucuronate 4-epimerase